MGGKEEVTTFKGRPAAIEFLNLRPMEADKGRFKDVEAKDFFEYFSPNQRSLLMNVYEEMLAKLCFVTGNNLTIETYGIMSAKGERNGWGELPYVIDGRAGISSLRIERVLADYEFKVLSIEQVGDLLKVEAERMPVIRYDEAVGMAFDVFDYDVIVEADIHCRDTFFDNLEKSGRVKGWKKWPKINWMVKDFRPWLFNPVMFCGRCEMFKGGIHRTMVAKIMMRDFLPVRIMKCWWKGERSCYGKEVEHA